MLTFSDVTFTGPGINFADNDIPNLLIRRPIITTLYTANATFVVPAFCESISVATVGGGGGGAVGIFGTAQDGGGGGGGGLSYCNNIKVIPDELLNIVIGIGGAGGFNGSNGSPSVANYGNNGGTSYIQRSSTGEILVFATGGSGGTTNGGLPGLGGRLFGAVGSYGGHGGGSGFGSGGGGGAGGFGNNGGNGSPGITITSATGGLGGGGGGGGHGYTANATFAGYGGGTALESNIYTASLTNGIAGSQGQTGTQGSDASGSPDLTVTFGGGGAGSRVSRTSQRRAGSGGDGGLLLLSPGDYRTFPRPTESQIPIYIDNTPPIINVNYSADFRSMTSSIYLNDSEATNLTNTNTIEFWMYMSGARPNVNVCLLSPGNINAAGLFVSINGNQLRIGPYYQVFGVSGLRGVFINTGTIGSGSWTHVVLQYNAGTLTVFINGYYRTYGSASGSGGFATSTATSLTVGNYAGGGNFNFNGLISNLRLTKGKMLYPTTLLTTSQRTFIPPTAPYNLTTNGSTPAGYGALTNPLETEVRSLAFSTSNITEDKSIFTSGIGTWIPNGNVPVSTFSPF